MTIADFLGLGALIIGIICVTAVIGDAYKRRLKFLERKLEITAGQAAERAAQYAAHNVEIENRLRVVEAIVTDGSWDTARQIENLREPGKPRAN